MKIFNTEREQKQEYTFPFCFFDVFPPLPQKQNKNQEVNLLGLNMD